jgi:hypothetical protein
MNVLEKVNAYIDAITEDQKHLGSLKQEEREEIYQKRAADDLDRQRQKYLSREKEGCCGNCGHKLEEGFDKYAFNE